MLETEQDDAPATRGNPDLVPGHSQNQTHKTILPSKAAHNGEE